MFILAGGGGYYSTPQPLVADYDQIMIPKYFIPKCQAEDHVHISWGGGYYTTPQPLVTDYDQIMIPKCFIWKSQVEDHARRGVIPQLPALSEILWSGYDPQMFHMELPSRLSCSY